LVEKPFRHRHRYLRVAGRHRTPDSKHNGHRAADESHQAGIEQLIDSVPGGGLAAFDCGNAEHRVTPFVGGEGCLGSWARHPTSLVRIPTDSLVDGSVNLVTGC
jgi:hypothetical protein